MTWLVWRIHRTESLIAAALLGIAALLLVVMGIQMSRFIDASGSCVLGGPTNDPLCVERFSLFESRFGSRIDYATFVNLLPLVAALLLASPLIGEFERGTYRFAWTQGTTRRRWIARRLALMFGATLALATVNFFVVRWWKGSILGFGGEWHGPIKFDLTGPVSFSYWLFALALVVSLGVLVRRTALTVGIATLVFGASRVFTEAWLRPRFRSPLETTFQPSIGVGKPSSTAWWVSQSWVDASGAQLSDQQVSQLCQSSVRPGSDQGSAVIPDCFEKNHLSWHLTYHPADRYWTFQAMESALFLIAAAALLTFAYLWVTRRIE